MDNGQVEQPHVCNCRKTSFSKPLPYTVDVPVELYKSLEGKYFVGYAEELEFGKGKSAWARLYNPPYSGVNLHVAVWTVSDIAKSPYRAQIWFNAVPPGIPQESGLIAPSNLALCPLPQPRVILQYGENVEGNPAGGIKAFVRRGQPETTMVADEEGKFIFAPCGSFMIYLSNPEAPNETAAGRVAFGWWEEPVM